MTLNISGPQLHRSVAAAHWSRLQLHSLVILLGSRKGGTDSRLIYVCAEASRLRLMLKGVEGQTHDGSGLGHPTLLQ